MESGGHSRPNAVEVGAPGFRFGNELLERQVRVEGVSLGRIHTGRTQVAELGAQRHEVLSMRLRVDVGLDAAGLQVQLGLGALALTLLVVGCNLLGADLAVPALDVGTVRRTQLLIVRAAAHPGANGALASVPLLAVRIQLHCDSCTLGALACSFQASVYYFSINT